MPLKQKHMNSGNIEYINLEELSNADYKIVDGEADVTGWPVIDESGSTVGKVRDLLFDPVQNAIRYLVVDLDNTVSADEKVVLIPIGIADVGDDKKEVVLPVLHSDQYDALPQYIIGEVTRDTELRIRTAIGSPAALRIEEEIVELGEADFYSHHHFDRGNNVGQTRVESHQKINTITDSDRREQQETIHDLVQGSEIRSHLHIHENSKAESFQVSTDFGQFEIEPQENGTYRILKAEEKIGVIYAEPAEDGLRWRTMDTIDDAEVAAIGNAISLHNA